MFPLQKLILTMDDEEAVLYRDCCYTVSHISMTRDGISLWNYSAVEDAWALANNWKLIRGTNDKAYCEMESWARRVGEGYREKDVLLGKREDVDRYLNNLIKEIKSKVTKRAMLEGDQREEHDENGREEEETGRGDFLTAEENLMHNQKAIKFSSNYTGYDSVERTDGFGAGDFKESGNIGDGFGGGKVVNEKQYEGWTVGVETKKAAINGHIEKNHENHIDHLLTKPIISHQNNLENEQNSQVFPPQKSILPLFSDSENSEAPEIQEEKPAAQNEGLEPSPGSPVPSVSFSDLDKAPSFIFNF